MPSGAGSLGWCARRTAAGQVMDTTGVNQLLSAVQKNEPAAWDRLMNMVYEDLKRIAHGQMARIAPGQTLTTTVLVHEAFEKLARQEGLPACDRSSFYALCACAMRQIIIDHYRRRSADKRSPVSAKVIEDFEFRRVNPESDHALLMLGRALDDLVVRDERMVQVFEMRYFAGMTDAEIASRLDLSIRTVQRIAIRARAWIVASLED